MVQENRPRLALPVKGYLEEATIEFLSECGLRVMRGSPRQYLGYIHNVPDSEIVFQRATDIPSLVQSGNLVLGITGYDVLAEHTIWASVNQKEISNDITILERDLGYGNMHLSIAVPESWAEICTCADLQYLADRYRTDPGRELCIAAKYPLLTEQFLRQKNITNCKIITPYGALEAAPLSGMSDFIVELTLTGTTLRENHLKLLNDGLILDSQACLIANAKLLQYDKQASKLALFLLEFIKAHLQAHTYSTLTAAFPGENDGIEETVYHRLQQVLGSYVSHFEIQLINSVPALYPKVQSCSISCIIDTEVPHTALLRAIAMLRHTGAISIDIKRSIYHFREDAFDVLIRNKSI